MTLNGHRLTDAELRAAELRIIEDPLPPPVDPEVLRELLDNEPELDVSLSKTPCRGGTCLPGSLCDNCVTSRRYVNLLLHRRQHGRPVHASDRAGFSQQPPKPKSAVEIIHDYLRERYRPVFRRGAVVHCADGAEITMATACIPDSKVISLLAAATDAPVELPRHGGVVKTEALPAFFKKWAAVAWGDLLRELPEELNAKMADDAPAGEKFRQLVREALLCEVVFGDVIGRTGVTQTERRSLIGWCAKWAKPGPWRSIRSKMCWCKLNELPDGEVRLQVAIRHELFAQVKADRWLCSLGQNKFARLAAKYGVGTCTRENRPNGMSAVVLNPEMIADLTADVFEPEEDLAEPTSAAESPKDGQKN